MEATLARASAQPTAVRRLDRPVLHRDGACCWRCSCCLPLFWLLVTSLRDAAKAFTLEHYRHLFVDPAFVKPLVTTLWTSAAVGVICVVTAAPMAWLVARTDLPGKRLLRMLILASFVTPPFLGAFAWVLLGGPNAGSDQPVVLRPVRAQAVRGDVAHQHLFRVGHGLRDGALHVSVRVHVRRQQPRHDSERARGGFGDPRRPGLAYRVRTSPCRWSCRRCLPGSSSRFCSR